MKKIKPIKRVPPKPVEVKKEEVVKEVKKEEEVVRKINYFIVFCRKEVGNSILDNTFISAKRPIKCESDIRVLEKRLNERYGVSTIKIVNFKKLGDD